jgi:hypothetical protein
MNILIYDVKQVHMEQLKHMVDAVKQVSKSDDWIVLPKGIDIIQDAPVDYLIHYRDMLNRCIEKQQEAKNERS